jgi:hypothetical protein
MGSQRKLHGGGQNTNRTRSRPGVAIPAHYGAAAGNGILTGLLPERQNG